MRGRAALPAVLGAALGAWIAALAGFGPGAWRAPVVGTAAGLMVLALARLAGLARREWRREPTPGRAYLAVSLLLLAALVLAGVATA